MINFLQKYEDLKKSIPMPGLRNINSENCENVDYVHHSKYCFYSFNSGHSEHLFYSTHCMGKYICDSYFAAMGELNYECVQSIMCYECIFVFNSANCRNCSFCSECVGCNDCFGCAALSHKQYCIWNKQYTKEEYEKKLLELKKQPLEIHRKQFDALWKKIPVCASHQSKTENCPYGDYINFSHNCYWIFDSFTSDNCGYLYTTLAGVDSWDISYGASSDPQNMAKKAIEHSYEISGGVDYYHCFFCWYCRMCTNCYYCYDCNNCTDCFGCVALSNKQYCILNNQFTKEEYERLVKQIREELGWTPMEK